MRKTDQEIKAELALWKATELLAIDDKYRQQLADVTRERDSARSLVKEICDEWNEDCDPTCDSYGHEKTCKAVNIAEAKKALKSQLLAQAAEIVQLRGALVRLQLWEAVLRKETFHWLDGRTSVQACIETALTTTPNALVKAIQGMRDAAINTVQFFGMGEFDIRINDLAAAVARVDAAVEGGSK